MQRITANAHHLLHDVAGTRRIEQAAAQRLPPHTLMQRAGLAVARLALAKVPHARRIWIACGPGNNGGDGLEAAMHLRQMGKHVTVTWLGSPGHGPDDAQASWARACAHGVAVATQPPADWDLCIDALLGIGARRAPQGEMAAWIAHMHTRAAPVLAVDLPSGLLADTGNLPTPNAIHSIANNADGLCRKADFTLCFLTLRPGLFTAMGKDMAGEVWLDTLERPGDPAAAANVDDAHPIVPCAQRLGAPSLRIRAHATHKGSFGDVAIIGGAPGMTGAAWLAATGALHAGAGRVFVGLLDPGGGGGSPPQPALMTRRTDELLQAPVLEQGVVVCGCGGGPAIAALLPDVLGRARGLVLDADALNAIAGSAALQSLLQDRAKAGFDTVLTPHPLEAARLLGTSVRQVQADRLQTAQQLSRRYACVAVLKGSGTVIAAPGCLTGINPTGNARLATAGTGDVLAGAIGAAMSVNRTLGQHAHRADMPALFNAVAAAVYQHGEIADQWPAATTLTADQLARHLPCA